MVQEAYDRARKMAAECSFEELDAKAAKWKRVRSVSTAVM
jgi:hypothetical protein